MKSTIKNCFLRTIYCSGTNRLIRYFFRKNPRIIMLHKITPSDGNPSSLTVDKFELLIKYIKKYYQPMKVVDLINFRKSKGFYPDNAVALTFDDGFKSFYDLALPVLRKHEVPASIYVCPMLIEKESWIWPDCLEYIYQEGYRDRCDKPLEEILKELKRVSSEQRDKYINDAYQLCNVEVPDVIPNEYQLLSWKMMQEISQLHLVEIGAHTLTHPILSTEDSETAWSEISGSKNMLQENLDIEVQSFCFPNGHPADYLPEHLKMVKNAGYLCGIASHFGLVTMDSDDMALPRISTGDSMLLSYKQLDGVEQFQRKLLNEL